MPEPCAASSAGSFKGGRVAVRSTGVAAARGLALLPPSAERATVKPGSGEKPRYAKPAPATAASTSSGARYARTPRRCLVLIIAASLALRRFLRQNLRLPIIH